MKFEVHQKHGFEPDETIPERIIRLANAESEKGAFRVDPAGAHSHRIPTNLRVSTIHIHGSNIGIWRILGWKLEALHLELRIDKSFVLALLSTIPILYTLFFCIFTDLQICIDPSILSRMGTWKARQRYTPIKCDFYHWVPVDFRCEMCVGKPLALNKES